MNDFLIRVLARTWLVLTACSAQKPGCAASSATSPSVRSRLGLQGSTSSTSGAYCSTVSQRSRSAAAPASCSSSAPPARALARGPAPARRGRPLAAGDEGAGGRGRRAAGGGRGGGAPALGNSAAVCARRAARAALQPQPGAHAGRGGAPGGAAGLLGAAGRQKQPGAKRNDYEANYARLRKPQFANLQRHSRRRRRRCTCWTTRGFRARGRGWWTAWRRLLASSTQRSSRRRCRTAWPCACACRPTPAAGRTSCASISSPSTRRGGRGGLLRAAGACFASATMRVGFARIAASAAPRDGAGMVACLAARAWRALARRPPAGGSKRRPSLFLEISRMVRGRAAAC